LTRRPSSGSHVVVASPLVVVSLDARHSVRRKRTCRCRRVRRLCRDGVISSRGSGSDVAGGPDLDVVRSSLPDGDIIGVASGVSFRIRCSNTGSRYGDSCSVVCESVACDIGGRG
jgi:hypothetical protein